MKKATKVDKKKEVKKIEKRKPSKQELDFKKKFYELMFELDLYNKFKRTYYLQILNDPEYGYYAHLYLTTGLSFDDLLKKKKVIEENLQCLWIMKVEQFCEYAEVQIIINSIDESVEYENPKIKPWQMYIGLSFSKKPIIINANKDCMFLIAGATGAGKTRLIYMMLLSWLLGCSPREVSLYISDIAKNEYINYQKIKHVRFYASDLDELFDMMQKIKIEFDTRKQLISKLRSEGQGTNIEDYNKVNKDSKISYCYILVDEFSVVVPDKTDSKDEKAKKEYVLDALKTLSKTGRSFGMFTIIATQKTTRDEIPSVIKNMSAVRISLRANDAISSEVIMGDNSAMGLGNRIAVYSTNGGSIQNYLFSPTLTIEMMNELLKPYERNNREIDPSKIKYYNKSKPVKKKNSKLIDYGGGYYSFTIEKEKEKKEEVVEIENKGFRIKKLDETFSWQVKNNEGDDEWNDY